MNDTDLLQQGTLITAAATFTTTYDIGVLLISVPDLQPYLSIVSLDNASVGINTMSAATNVWSITAPNIEEIDITGSTSEDITVGNLRAQVLQALTNYNTDHYLKVQTPAVTIGAGPASPIGTGGGVADALKAAGDAIGKATGFATVVLIGLAIFIGYRIFREVEP